MTGQGAAKTSSELAGADTVFIVDDDEDMVRSLESLLRSLGYRVEAFTSAQGFLDRVAGRVFGCLLLDVRLPGVSGLEIQRRLAEARNAIPIIFLTGHGDIEMAVAAMKAGAIEFLPKPFREQQLIDAVGNALERAARAREDDRLRSAYLDELNGLSFKERQILDDLSAGLQIKEIASARALSASTVRVHRRNIKTKIKSFRFSTFALLHNKYLDDKHES